MLTIIFAIVIVVFVLGFCVAFWRGHQSLMRDIAAANAALPDQLEQLSGELGKFRQQVKAGGCAADSARAELNEADEAWASAKYHLSKNEMDFARREARRLVRHLEEVHRRLSLVRILSRQQSSLARKEAVVSEPNSVTRLSTNTAKPANTLQANGFHQLTAAEEAAFVAKGEAARALQLNAIEEQKAYCKELGLEWSEMNEVEKNVFYRRLAARRQTAPASGDDSGGSSK